jgi:hypothetical protein
MSVGMDEKFKQLDCQKKGSLGDQNPPGEGHSG